MADDTLEEKREGTQIHTVDVQAAPVVYANHVTFKRTPTEIVLGFCRIDPEYGDAPTEDGIYARVGAPVLVRVLLPEPVGRALMLMLEQQFPTSFENEGAEGHDPTE